MLVLLDISELFDNDMKSGKVDSIVCQQLLENVSIVCCLIKLKG